MKQSETKRRIRIVNPEARGGATVEVVPPQSKAARERMENEAAAYARQILDSLHGDENLVLLSSRVKGFTEKSEMLLGGLKTALLEEDAGLVARWAHEMSEQCGRFGAVSMMKLGIALEMVGRAGLMERAGDLFQELETEYTRYKRTIYYEAS